MKVIDELAYYSKKPLERAFPVKKGKLKLEEALNILVIPWFRNAVHKIQLLYEILLFQDIVMSFIQFSIFFFYY